MNIPSLEFYVESIRHLTSSVAIRRMKINKEEMYKNSCKEALGICSKAIFAEEDNTERAEQLFKDFQYLQKAKKEKEVLLRSLRAKQKHEKRMIAYFVAQQRDILDYYKATDELYEETL